MVSISQIRLLESNCSCPKVILLSGAHCNTKSKNQMKKINWKRKKIVYKSCMNFSNLHKANKKGFETNRIHCWICDHLCCLSASLPVCLSIFCKYKHTIGNVYQQNCFVLYKQWPLAPNSRK